MSPVYPRSHRWFQVSSFGFQAGGSRFRVQGSRFRIQDTGFRVQGPGFRVQGSGLYLPRSHKSSLVDRPHGSLADSGFRVQGFGFRDLDSGLRVEASHHLRAETSFYEQKRLLKIWTTSRLLSDNSDQCSPDWTSTLGPRRLREPTLFMWQAWHPGDFLGTPLSGSVRWAGTPWLEWL